ncbi:hypothetical protein STCU_11189 [Strigomonas culicis]|uniref:Uncharacterized protein n=1 Tax=Strigomonas culicis TaxID=28005 RepID=S9TJH0_9TRYP|nr:hypothetical protein STCU_11189 [Strigomonas culicis]|eukprot:EPY16508.1 hypothetical protein STCU_11189 [Strigomonas culicis]
MDKKESSATVTCVTTSRLFRWIGVTPYLKQQQQQRIICTAKVYTTAHCSLCVCGLEQKCDIGYNLNSDKQRCLPALDRKKKE